MKKSAVSLVQNAEGLVLCVWNKRYHGWTLPGGLVEPGETVRHAQVRELQEETGLDTFSADLVITMPLSHSVVGDRSSTVHLFRVQATGEARQMEEGCPIAWMSVDELLFRSPFSDWYRVALREKLSL